MKKEFIERVLEKYLLYSKKLERDVSVFRSKFLKLRTISIQDLYFPSRVIVNSDIRIFHE